MYRTSDGKLVELPPDMTVEEAARLEAEAKTAEKRLGKGPPPKPVPDVRELVRKEGKKEKPKPEAKGKKYDKGKGKAAPRAGGAVTAMLKASGPGKVAQYLAAKGAPTLFKGFGMLQKLKQNEQTHDDAAEKLQQSEKAVVIPPAEGQSKSNAGQVNAVSAKPAPVADEKKAKQTLQESLKDNIPQSIEDVDNFKRDKKAQHMGADVMKVVRGDTNAVISTFGDMEGTPPPAPPEHTPEALPPEELAPPTATMNLGQGAIASLQKEHTDVSNYTKEADSKLKEEGVTQEQLDMVDSGDLAEANKEKKGMEKTAKTEPLAVQKFAQQESDKVENDLRQEEKKGRDGLKAKRKSGLSMTAQKQKGAKGALEKKRDEVAKKINGIYTKAQDSVKKKLSDLETKSMKRFDDGNAKATKEFEDNVKREIDAFKAERYSGSWGWAKKDKDWLLGMDDLPQVKAIFDRNRTAFVNTINKLVEDISADNKRVIQECKDELVNAKNEIKEYVDKLDPNLKDIGKKAADEMNAKLAEMDQFIAQKEEDLQNKLKDKQTAAIKAIDEKIEKMKDSMSGALSKLGKLLLLAAKKFFTWALEKVGFSLADIEGIINKGVAVLKAIFTKPIQFVKNLMNAAITGFKNFGKNFLKHLKNALFEWLTGSLEGLVLPQTWDFKGIVGIALQMIGISYQNIRKHMVTVMGEPVVAALEKTFTLVKTLITEGPMAAWEQLKEMAAEMRDAFIEAVKDFIKTKIIEQAIQWLVSLFIPGAGIIKAIIGIYDTIVFFIQKAKQIMQMISSFLGSIAEIAAGNIGAAADAMENGLARGLSLVISFLAQLLHLSGITRKIRDAIQKIRNKVDAVLLKVAKWIADKAKNLFAKAKGALTMWWKASKPVEGAAGEKHTLFMQGEGANAKLIIKSDPTPYRMFVNGLKTQKDKNPALKLADQLDKAIATASKASATANAGEMIEKSLGDLAAATVPLLSGAKTKSTPPVFGARVGGFGSSVTVLKLTDEHGKGGEPTVEDGDWQVLRKRLDGKGTYYVRGHLLNHNLGGPGNTWDNLTPLTQNANNRASDSMLKTFEKPIKDATKEGSAINFAVTVTYGRSHPLASKVAKYEKSGDPEVKMVGKIVKAEKFVPKSLRCKGSQIDAKGNIGSVVAQTTVENVIQDRFDDYFLTGESKQIFKINGASAADLQKLYGIDKATATAIASKGPYESFDQVMKAGSLTATQWKAARETPRLRVVLDI